ncbi:MAG TPA: magnesium-translocating P-type ATPase [Bryobacteraceae bacterium]|nr:magnesium-translocating P-type ATPase [Bryobacteraceae bacterium]
MALPNYWSESTDELLRDLQSSPRGLTSQEAALRLAQFGLNSLSQNRRASAAGLLLTQFRNPLLLVLVAAAVVSAYVGEWVDAGIVITVVTGSALLSFFQEFAATRAMEKLRSRIEAKAVVIRDGHVQTVSAETVVRGDVISLAAGSLIAADAVLLEARDFFVNQAVLTGETFPAEKVVGPVAEDSSLSERTNTVFLGTSVRSGTARAVVVQTGSGTAFGQIAGRLNLRPPETSFERGIRHFGYLLTKVMLLLVTAVFAINVFDAKPPVDSLLFAIALAVGLAPELLPAILTITLAHGAQQMAKRGVIVRRLSAIENLGSMNVLCTDKTGTLTEGVVRLDGALSPDGEASTDVLRLAFWNAHFQTGLPNPLDEAIVQSGNMGLAEGCTKTDEIPYDFTRKRLSVVIERQGIRTLVTKGALDNVLAVCRDVPPLGHDRFAAWSAKGMRVLGIATRTLDPGEAAEERDLQFAGFLLFFDPPKQGVEQVIEQLTQSGISIKMISGDNRLVAAHVAARVGLGADSLLTGRELQHMSDEALWQRAGGISLFVEVDPNQKERIIRALQKTGHTVGYMGDGINDAPALHAADVGISVDSAVDVAKESADFVLLEQDLNVLRQGIDEGRRTFANTLKYIFTTTSANFGNMFSMAGASLFLPFLPLLAKQILLNNFLSDIPGMAIASDDVDEEWIRRPHRWDMNYIRNFMVIFGLVSSFFDYVTFGVLLWVMRASEQEFRTGWFVESVLTELAVALVVRTRLPFYRSRPGKWLAITTAIIAGFTLALPYLPGSSELGFIPLPGRLLALVIGITALYVLAAEAAKHYFHRNVVLPVSGPVAERT